MAPTPQSSGSSATARPSLVAALRLENFMLHEDSTISFATPITLLTGANGSGKTQILDALMLALGSKTTRVRKEGVSELVGPAGDEARITLTLRNPTGTGSGDRVLSTGDRATDKSLNAELVNVVIDLTRDQNALTYRLGPAGKEKRVSQSAIERMFATAGVTPRNRLAFTEEGTISSFSSESQAKQFEAFLETTQLLELRELLEKLQTEVGNAKARLDPLQQNFHMQANLLEHMATDLDNLRRREELEAQVEDLKREAAWAEAREAGAEAEAIHQKMQAQLDRQKAAREKKAKAEKKLEEARVRIDRYHSEMDGLTALLRDRDQRIGSLQEGLKHNRELMETHDSQLEKAADELDLVDKKIRDAGGEEAAKELNAAREAWEAAVGALKEIERQLFDARATAENALPGEGLFGGTMRAKGLDFLANTMRVRDAATQAGLGDPDGGDDAARKVFGPLLLEIAPRSGLDDATARRVREALPAVLGEAIVGFVARDEKALTALQKLIDEKATHDGPFRIWLAEGDAAGALPESKGIVPLVAQIDAPEPVRDAIAAACPAAIAVEKTTLAAARSYARKYRCTVYLAGEQRLVTPHGIAWPDPAAAEAAGRLEGGIEQLRIAAEALAKQRDLEPQREQARADRDAAHEAYEQLRVQQEEVDKLQRQRKALVDRHDQISDARSTTLDRIDRYESDLHRLENDDSNAKKREQKARDLDNERTIRTKAEAEIGGCEKEITQAEGAAGHYHNELNGAKTVALRTKEAASLHGAEPQERRQLPDIQQQLATTQGTLEGLQRITRTRAEYEAKKAEVEELRQGVEKAKEHLDGLEEDLRTRLREWKSELADRLTGARRVIRHLLRDHFERVELRVVEQAKKGRAAGEKQGALELKCSRRGGPLLNLSGLSGGEKVLVVGALIFALHCLTDSPIHALDEFTQKLDVEFKSAAFRMALEAVAYARDHADAPYAPQFVLLSPDTLGVAIDSDDVRHVVVVRAETRAEALPMGK